MASRSNGEPREMRAARNQALFRAVNEKLEDLSEAFEAVVRNDTMTCECADLDCIATVEIGRDEYADVRRDPTYFIVLPGHVVPDVERIVQELGRYVVVEKVGEGAKLLEAADRGTG